MRKLRHYFLAPSSYPQEQQVNLARSSLPRLIKAPGVPKKTHQVRNMLVMVRDIVRDKRCRVLCGFTQNDVLRYGLMKNCDLSCNIIFAPLTNIMAQCKRDQKSICLLPLTTCSCCFRNEVTWPAAEGEGLRL